MSTQRVAVVQAAPVAFDRTATLEKVARPVAVAIAQGNRLPKLVAVFERACEAAGDVADLLLGLDGPVGIEEQNPHSTAVAGSGLVTRAGAAVVIAGGSDHHVRHAVAVEITEPGGRTAEPIVVAQYPGEASLGAADLLLGLDRPVGV